MSRKCHDRDYYHDSHHHSHRQRDIPIHMDEMAAYDNEFANLKERFAAQMRRVEEEMSKFSADLVRLTQAASVFHAGATNTFPGNATYWDDIVNSPLVEDEGNGKILTLRFDVSQYQPNEVSVNFVNNALVVSATHKEKADNANVHNEFMREFHLPPDTDPDTMESRLTKDGVLTVRIPLNLPSEPGSEDDIKKISLEN